MPSAVMTTILANEYKLDTLPGDSHRICEHHSEPAYPDSANLLARKMKMDRISRDKHDRGKFERPGTHPYLGDRTRTGCGLPRFRPAIRSDVQSHRLGAQRRI